MAPLTERGATIGVVFSLRDTTDERRARDAVSKSEARYRNLFESATDAIYTIDPRGSFTSVNSAMSAMLGLPRDQLVGKGAFEFLDPEETKRVTQYFDAALRGEVQHYECHFRPASGDRLLVSVINSPIRSGEEVAGVLGIARDITRERGDAEEREALRQQLTQSQKLEAIGQLVSGVAHELNNPLAAVMAYAQLLLGSSTLSEDERESADTIHREARRAARIVANLLTFARQHKPERRLIDLNEIVRNTIELRRYALRGQGIDVQTQLDPSLPHTLGDSFQLQQVFLNLIANSEHALRSVHRDRVITIRTWQAGASLSVSVSDTGEGIAPEALPQIFNPFYTTKEVGEGTGLGLSISDGIVREHGGRIAVESTLGVGSMFTVELPLTEPASAMDAGRLEKLTLA
jgi:two-component system NtrC family sensor kinase